MTHQKKPRKKLNTLSLLDEAKESVSLDQVFAQHDYDDYSDYYEEESMSVKQASQRW